MELKDLEKLKNGDKIKIGKDVYEVLFVQGEADARSDKDPPIRLFLAIYLHDHKTDSLFPTHEIRYYYEDTKEIFLIELRGKLINKDDIESV